mmetsp:Transcript_29020/g.47153  ORF Transcript_29020/g.47153 Transcript_29020/m.47153 type:complete len:86 (-) Transcript_29020:214-471(-)
MLHIYPMLLRARPDKNHPNFLTTCMNTFEALCDDIKKEDIISMCTSSGTGSEKISTANIVANGDGKEAPATQERIGAKRKDPPAA